MHMISFDSCGRVGSQKKDLIPARPINHYPGPGQYEGKTRIGEAPQFGFGSSARDPKKQDNTPGPGSYRVPYRVADVPTYSGARKTDE